MLSAYFSGLALLAAVAAASPARIIGGNPAPIERYQSVVQVESLNQGFFWLHQCGGSILNAVNVLSAAHCFSGSSYTAENRRIRAGTAIKESGGVILHVSQAFNHPSFEQNGNDGDISVVRLSSAFIFSPTVNQQPIVIANTNFPAGMIVTKVGWGISDPSSAEHSQELREIQVPIVDLNVCRQNYASLSAAPPVTANMFCAGSAVADSCDGDGGSPIFISNIVVGIISWGNGCLVPGFPGVNTAVSQYSDWIINTVSS